MDMQEGGELASLMKIRLTRKKNDFQPGRLRNKSMALDEAEKAG